jgi:hypothetical protein
MTPKFIASVLVFVPFTWALYYLLKRREYFHPLYPFGFAAVLLAVARVADVPIENPGLSVASWFGFAEGPFVSFLTLIGNLADVFGVTLLVFGFIRAIESLRSGERRIETLEALLPMCAWCKRVRTEEGMWKPVEEYLRDRGAPEAAHGICPDCARRLLHDQRGNWTNEGQVPENPAEAT